MLEGAIIGAIIGVAYVLYKKYKTDKAAKTDKDIEGEKKE